ncbi:MAG: type VI secretion system tip protein TssI/VgrG [Planktomarina sp.]|nr:type VI secretion system tip protein TssI/VgrG [Planktomarina sp.]
MASTDNFHVKLTFKDAKCDDAVVTGFVVEERLSQVPLYQVTINDLQTDLSDFIGQEAVLSFEQDVYAGEQPRTFSGIVTDAERQVAAQGDTSVALTLQPMLAVLRLSKHSALYQKKTALDILTDVLTRNGLKQLKVTAKAGVKRDTTIQYNENDLSFCERLLAEEGFTYFFSDGQAPDTLMIHDTKLRPFPSVGPVVELTDAQLSDVSRQQAQTLNAHHSIQAGKVSLVSYDPEKAAQAKAGPKPSSALKLKVKPAITEHRPVPVGDLTKHELTRAIGAHKAAAMSLHGTCEYPAMQLGQELNIVSETHMGIAGRYIVTAFTYTPARDNALSCGFEAAPIDHLPVPKRLPKPEIAGVHNALVVGGDVGAVACDAQGRVQVKFFWDTSGDSDKTSGFIRVAEPFAGKGYGAQFIPRVGHEVLVSFLHGDPDAPVITGQIYNEKNQPPFAIANSTKSGIRSQLKGEANELEFDDKDGTEMFALRAAKDFELIVNENAVEKITKLQTIWVGETSKVTIDKDQVVEVAKTAEFKADERKADIAKGETVNAKTITLSANSKITLVVGSSKIELTDSGIKISATKVDIEGKSGIIAKSNGTVAVSGTSTKIEAKSKLDVKGAMVNVTGQAQTKISGAMAEVSGSGMLTLKGGITMIN